jgi:hypothetical protein
MNLRAFILGSSLLFLAMPVFAREYTDVIILKNGDRLTGNIKGISADVLYVDLDYVDGTISIQWSKVAHFESKQQFIVKTENGLVYTGTLKALETPSGQPTRIQVTGKLGNGAVLDSSRIVSLDETSEKFWQRLNGAVSFGTTYSKGNQSNQYNLSSEAQYLRERWRAQTNFSSNLSSSSGASASARNGNR